MSLPTIVAHEGNPRTDSLTVAGTLDGTPTIIPPTPSPDPTVEPPQPDPPTDFPGTATTCPGVFSWARTDGYKINGITPPWHLTDEDGSSVDWSGNDPPHYILFDRYVYHTISPSMDCYGIMWTPIQFVEQVGRATSAGPNIVEYYAPFTALVSGSPLAGPCIYCVSNDTTADNVDAIALIPDFDAGTVGLYLFEDASLSNIANATLIDSGSYTAATDDVFYFQSWQDAIYSPTHTLFAAVYSANLASTKWSTTQNPYTLSPNRPNFGFVAVGGQTGVVAFGADAARQGFRVETDSLPDS